ncbi:hypothetical protein PsorP6_002150 [Peronosclerospora sorghi]|uniref:Uncharacterized protein n=1 Tax=Peronosclerospora sorghi TaxID=230839 RepID=A0ACC0WX76_9STRA|nr:hypothetical protein PsorP6_002150 [Peronosclerospora sorghi]
MYRKARREVAAIASLTKEQVEKWIQASLVPDSCRSGSVPEWTSRTAQKNTSKFALQQNSWWRACLFQSETARANLCDRFEVCRSSTRPRGCGAPVLSNEDIGALFSLGSAQDRTLRSRFEYILDLIWRQELAGSQLVYEADMVSRELISVAILWNELWHGALEEASKHFFNNRDVAAMIADLDPLYEQMDQISTEETPTLRGAVFYQTFARDLKYAKEWPNVYERTKSLDDLNHAWDIYYGVFSRIRKQLANLSTLELMNVHQAIGTVRDVQSNVLRRKEAVGASTTENRLDEKEETFCSLMTAFVRCKRVPSASSCLSTVDCVDMEELGLAARVPRASVVCNQPVVLNKRSMH